ncbi:MAG: hypothetical protein ACAH80_03005 [Alphaproteobacteria bacterium]
MNDNKKDEKIAKPVPAEEIEIPRAINIALLEPLAAVTEKEDKPV